MLVELGAPHLEGGIRLTHERGYMERENHDMILHTVAEITLLDIKYLKSA